MSRMYVFSSPICFNTTILGNAMKHAADLLENSDAKYTKTYINKIRAIGVKLNNMNLEEAIIGDRNDFAKMFPESFPKGLTNYDSDIVWVFVKIAQICQDNSKKNHSDTTISVEKYIRQKIEKKQIRDNTKKNQSNDKSNQNDAPAVVHVYPAAKMEEKDELNSHININNNNNNNNNNEAEEEEKKHECEDITSKVNKMENDKSDNGIMDSGGISGVSTQHVSKNVKNNSNDSNNLSDESSSVTYWRKIEKLTKEEINVKMDIENDKKFSQISKTSPELLATEIYYAYLKLDENPSLDEYGAYPKSKDTVLKRQILLMLLILDCDKFDVLFNKYNLKDIEKPCLKTLSELKQQTDWASDKDVKENTKLKFLFHWYRCTFGGFWNSSKKLNQYIK